MENKTAEHDQARECLKDYMGEVAYAEAKANCRMKTTVVEVCHLMREYASLQCAEMKKDVQSKKETIAIQMGQIDKAQKRIEELERQVKLEIRGRDVLSGVIEESEKQSAEMKKELAGLKDVIGVYENLVIATQTYLQSISGRDLVHDQEAFNKVDAISNELNEKYKALNLVPHDTINKP